MNLTLGPMHILTAQGGIDDLLNGRSAAPDLDALLPRSASLRRASEDSKRAAIVGSAAMADLGGVPRERIGLYVAQQHGAHDACAEFLRVARKDGPRLVSPMLFSESVANIAATHLSLALKLTGVVETVTGTRAAGLQALTAVEDDLEADVIDGALVVVNGMAGPLLGDAYAAVYRRPARAIDLLPGAAAFAVKREGGTCRVHSARVGCIGRGWADPVPVLMELWRGQTADRVVVSALAADHRRALANAGFATQRDGVCHALPESFVLDPFLQLAADARIAPHAASRAVIVMGEEGMVGVLSVEGPVEAR